VDNFIDHKAALDKRKKQMLFKKWSERVYSPVKVNQSLNRRIFVYNICLITISDTVSDGATKRLLLNIERAQHD